MIKLYENIKELRKKNGWSQDELAKRTGYTDRSSIAKIEAGAVDLPESKIMLFAKVFDVDPWFLMGLKTASDTVSADSPQKICSPALALSGLEQEIISRFRQADEFDQETVLRTLRIKRADYIVSEEDAG